MKELSMDEIQSVAGGLNFPTVAEWSATIGGGLLFAAISKSPAWGLVFDVAKVVPADQAAKAANVAITGLDIILLLSSGVVGAVAGHAAFSAAHILHKMDERTP